MERSSSALLRGAVIGLADYAANDVMTGSRDAIQFHGRSAWSSFAFVRPETMRSRTSVNHTIGSTPFSFAVWISDMAIDQ